VSVSVYVSVTRCLSVSFCLLSLSLSLSLSPSLSLSVQEDITGVLGDKEIDIWDVLVDPDDGLLLCLLLSCSVSCSRS
jgi:hypothetical protein